MRTWRLAAAIALLHLTVFRKGVGSTSQAVYMVMWSVQTRTLSCRVFQSGSMFFVAGNASVGGVVPANYVCSRAFPLLARLSKSDDTAIYQTILIQH